MSCFALIIESSDVKGEQDLPGARKDAQNWADFLQSDLGGNWDESVIRVLNKPSRYTVEYYLETYRDRYCFVAFSGHGYHDRRSDQTRICLNDSEKDCYLAHLLPKSAKGTLVSDACRGLSMVTEGAESQRIVANSVACSDDRFFKPASLRYSPRELWLGSLQASPQGKVTMYSCNFGESAGEYETDTPAAGGYYTTALIQSAKQWQTMAEAQSTKFTTKVAHLAAAAYLARTAPQQNPQFTPPNLQFPFAVKV